MIISFVNQKGGCAKSTTALHFVYWLMRHKKSVILVDADPQKSSSTWANSLTTPITTEIVQGHDNVIERLPELDKSHDFVVVDGPGGIAEVSRAILMMSSLTVVPCQPTQLDVGSVADTARLISVAKRIVPRLKTATFVARATPRAVLLREAQEALSLSGLGLLETVIHQSQVVADVPGQGKTVWDLQNKAAVRAASEFDNLFAEIMEVSNA